MPTAITARDIDFWEIDLDFQM